jgi:general stress protein CsbA
MGSIIFFSFIGAPGIFKTLEREKAGEVAGVIFPKYYILGYICSGLILLALIAGSAKIPLIQTALVLGMAICSLIAGMVIGPKAKVIKARIKNETGNGETLKRTFNSLHGWSVRLNAAVLLMGLVLLWRTAMGLIL